MSVFDKYTRSGYVEVMRKFLGVPKKGFLKGMGLVTDEPRFGRAPRYADEPVVQLELQVNAKASRVEAKDTTVGERIQLARDYAFTTDAEISRAIGLTREMIRRWSLGLNPLSQPERLAEVLKVPVEWLLTGDTSHLLANSTLGVCVGEEALNHRESLFAMTQQLLGELDSIEDDEYVQAYLEWAVFDKAALSYAARKAGGRWQFLQGRLHFVPWEPIEKHELTRRLWSDEVETIIEEELNKPGQTIYRAWAELKQRCEALGMTEDDYPTRIGLFKRVEKERKRAEKFGVDLNDMISASVKKHSETESA